MWKIKTFRTREGMKAWLAGRAGLIQWQEVFVANRYAVEWRPLRQPR